MKSCLQIAKQFFTFAYVKQSFKTFGKTVLTKFLMQLPNSCNFNT